MDALPQPSAGNLALTCQQMRELDRKAIEDYHIRAETLMEKAGTAIADEAGVFLRLQHVYGEVLVFCGSGNNGGDGLVAARILRERDFEANAILVHPVEKLRKEAIIALQRAQGAGVEISPFHEYDIIQERIERCALIIDAMLGTGSRGALEGELARMAGWINASGKPVIAVDIPSGLDGDAGTAPGTCVKATTTVTFGALKKGFLNPQSRFYTGPVRVADIGYPGDLIQKFRPTA